MTTMGGIIVKIIQIKFFQIIHETVFKFDCHYILFSVQ